MGDTYQITVKNTSGQDWTVCFYAQLPTAGHHEFVSAAWVVTQVADGQQGFLRWNVDWQAACIKTTGMKNGATFTNVVTHPADIKKGDTFTLVTDPSGALNFAKAPSTATPLPPGHIGIDNQSHSFQNLGLCVEGSVVALTKEKVAGNVSLDMTVTPTYYVGITQGQVIKSVLVNADEFFDESLTVQFVDGATDYLVTIGTDGKDILLTGGDAS